jgi:hypothetical protein
MVAAILMYVGLTFLVFKAVWNLNVPYRLARRPCKKETDESDPIGCEIGFDLVFLGWTLGFLLFADEAYLFFGKFAMGLLCVAIPVATIVHFFVASCFQGKPNGP